MGPRVCQLLATLWHTLCVALSLTLFALGGTDPASEFYLRTVSFSRHMTIVGPVLDMVVVSLDVEGVRCKE
jgi:hypothetical protein